MKLYLGTDPGDLKDLIHYPIIKTVPLEIPSHILEDFADYTHILFTSKNAVRILLTRMHQEELKNKQLIAIGKSTAAKLTQEGFVPHLVAQDESQEGVIEVLKHQDLRNAYIFYPRSSLARKKLEHYLSSRAVRHQICDLYETVFQKPEPVPDFEKIDEIIFTSPSTVKGFVAVFGAIPANKKLTCIGPITEEELKKSIQ
ncbi:MAG TPA: uroporphyrinogen-III synthase [Rhabdochlamydiaceae bacterium]|jgi:uroporphyrinogen-III synthase|nr:uroporphyrinogen-III synthase [Rhabdochlamydiaceae bacterium]